jgi:hypothetical protein
VTGYGDEEFEWDHHRLANRLDEQYRQRPEGPHCENTKIWFYCNTAAALGMYLYDRVYGKETHRSAQNFLEYARQNYVGVSGDGKLQWVTRYYDPLVNWKLNAPPVAGGPLTAFLLAPQDREFASFLYEAAVEAAGVRAPNATVRANTDLLLMARELGDSAVADKLQAAAERDSYAASADRRGASTSFRITNLPDAGRIAANRPGARDLFSTRGVGRACCSPQRASS